ncbi:MAG: pyridoxamine 5'-phosphate oxidase family protein [Planctomycetota bacterium]
MSKLYEEITPELQAWIDQQKVFFVATAPAGVEGHINCSPKGLDSLRVLGPRSVGYIDLTGSGAETIAHLQENGRVCLMFCALSGPPKIVRLHGAGTVITPDAPAWATLADQFPDYPSARSIIRVDATRISDSCGYGVPRYEFADDRDTLTTWADKKGANAVTDFQQEHNLESIDGLPALNPK